MKNQYSIPEQILIDTVKRTFNYGYEDAESYANYLRGICLRIYEEDK